jgi:transcriptional regulator with XRE-family HTH domain
VESTHEWLTRPGGIAQRLLDARKAAGLTGERLATILGWPRSKVSKLENGRQTPSDLDVQEWVQACGAGVDVERDLLEELTAGRARHRQWRHELRRGQVELQVDLRALLQGASRVRNFEVMLIPGLIQTAGYARYRVLENVRVYGVNADEVDATVAARMALQDVIYDRSKQFEFLVSEAALHAGLCPPDVMAAQLDRLLGLAGMPNLTFGIIPFGADPPIAPLNGFLMVDDTTLVETFASEIQLHGEESAAYERIVNLLREAALTDEKAREMILRVQEVLLRDRRQRMECE